MHCIVNEPIKGKGQRQLPFPNKIILLCFIYFPEAIYTYEWDTRMCLVMTNNVDEEDRKIMPQD